MKENWKPIEGYDGFFISDLGRVKRQAYTKIMADGTEKVIDEAMLPITTFQDSKYVSLSGRSCLVHLLVARAFLDAPEQPSSRAEFIDGDRSNCAASNLRWVSISDITKRDIAQGRRTNPSPYKGRRIQCIDSGETFDSIKELCEVLNLPRSYVTKRIYAKEPINNKLYKRA